MAISIDKTVLERLLPREQDTHKGSFGTLCMLCGSEQMPGAAYLAASGALRSGIGLLKVAAEGTCKQVLQSRLAEPVWVEPSEISRVDMTAFLCGCGLGRQRDELLPRLLPSIAVPAVYDADCINFFALHRHVMDELSAPYVITPHPMEFARLTGRSTAQIQSDRVHEASRFAIEHGCVVVLKGHGTVVASPDGRTAVNSTGSNGLAKGGSGDVLAGVIASLLAQGQTLFDAACIGVYAHGLAGDLLSARYGARGMLPSDLPLEIGTILG